MSIPIEDVKTGGLSIRYTCFLCPALDSRIISHINPNLSKTDSYLAYKLPENKET